MHTISITEDEIAMTRVEYRKCQSCGKVAHVSEFKPSDAVGRECLNQVECRNRTKQNETPIDQVDRVDEA